MKKLLPPPSTIIRITILFSFCLLNQVGIGQKKTLTFETYKDWNEISAGGLSNDGMFTFYMYGMNSEQNKTLVLVSSKGHDTIAINNVITAKFSDDSKFLICYKPNDTIIIVNNKSKNKRYLKGSLDYKLISSQRKEIIAYTHLKTLCIETIDGSWSRKFDNVQNYNIAPDGQNIILRKQNIDGKLSMFWIDLESPKEHHFYTGSDVDDIIFNKKNDEIAFISTDINSSTILTHKKGENTVTPLISNLDLDSTKKYVITAGNFKFSNDQKSIFFSITGRNEKTESINASNPVVWNYKDVYLRSEYYMRRASLNNLTEYLCIINKETKVFNRLINKNEHLIDKTFQDLTDSIIVLESSFGMVDEPFIESTKKTYILCFTRTGEKITFLIKNKAPIKFIEISPKSNYILYYNPSKKSYFTYRLKDHKTINISEKIPGSIFRYYLLDEPGKERLPAGVSGWMKNEDGILINGTYDLWLTDPNGITPSKKLTGNVGEASKVTLNIIPNNNSNIYNWNDEVNLVGLNTITKNMEFYKLRIKKTPKVEFLSSQKSYTFGIESGYFEMIPNTFLKSKYTNSYLLKMENTINAPNFYYSRNLINFDQISDIQPQKKFNWIKSQLHKYTDNQNKNYEGILYVPENIDTTRKYPILFLYYELLSNQFNKFPEVELPPANFSIPIAVSQGYLVFLPNISSKIGSSGDGALNSVLAAVNHLTQFKWVDTSKMGICGHSFGGFETNYIITRTNKFKAAVSCAGVSDFISTPYDIWGLTGGTMQDYFKNGSAKMGVSFTDNPEPYLRNSPILYARNINTPLLLMHNVNDPSVPYTQSRQLFLTLRSMQKPVWLLNYRDEGHALANEFNRLDYNKKVLTFYDFYLKGAKEPSWMAKYISIDSE